MYNAMDKVKAFHEKLGVSGAANLTQLPEITFIANTAMSFATGNLKAASDWLEAGELSDPRALRVHLMAEELSEVIDALLNGDELETLDALADLMYVVVGTAVTFDLPLPAAFDEVHRSNMTKERQSDDPAAPRVRQKGPNYRAPNLARILEEHRR